MAPGPKEGDIITFQAQGDNRLFRIMSIDGDMARLVCPCCGLEGGALVTELEPVSRERLLAAMGLQESAGETSRGLAKRASKGSAAKGKKKSASSGRGRETKKTKGR